jgi:hypothetical protein
LKRHIGKFKKRKKGNGNPQDYFTTCFKPTAKKVKKANNAHSKHKSDCFNLIQPIINSSTKARYPAGRSDLFTQLLAFVVSEQIWRS